MSAGMMMRRLIIICTLFMAFELSLAAQTREEGMAICFFEESGDILYATHKTHPFGTKLIITNPVNQARITVQIGGRPDPVTNAIIEISTQAAEELGMYSYYPNWVWINSVPQENAAVKQHVQRARLGVFRQAGNAIVTAGNDLTASHTSLPFGTKVKVTNVFDNRSATVTVTGRIRASGERIIEISQAAAQILGVQGRTGPVRIESVDK